jgi:Zn-dependent protease
MLYALRHPVALGGLALGFVVAVVVHAWARGELARRTRQTGLLSAPAGPRDARRQTDPFGLVALILAGVGWMRPLEPAGRWRAGRVRRIALALSGPVANLVVGSAAFLAYRAMGGSGPLAAAVGARSSLQGSLVGTAAEQLVAGIAFANLAMAVLEVVPIPPLEGADVLFSLVPPTPGWQRVRHYLAEQNWGVAVVLLLVLLPIAGNAPPLLELIDIVVRAVMNGLDRIVL